MTKQRMFIPALRFAWLTPLYDPFLRWVMREDRFKKELIRQAEITPGQKVLDLGCGTATLTIMVKEAYPGTEVVGLDADPKVLSIGRAKALKAGVSVTLDHGMSYALLYSENAFDRVLSSLMFHHLTSQKKQQTLKEVYRVLKKDGWLWIVDFGPPVGLWARMISPLMARLEEVGDHHKRLIPVMMRDAGFQDVVERCRFATVFGTLNLYGGRK
ncbi:MAG TPA: methyltransferase domain-containing protein [Anaerolineaceae bacterium]|nr:methyltransferase domain-containing protein [Anaerolineaceae bacterium]